MTRLTRRIRRLPYGDLLLVVGGVAVVIGVVKLLEWFALKTVGG